MRLKAELIVEVDAIDFIDAANHQQTIEKLADSYRAVYPNLKFSFKQVKEAPIANGRQELRKMPRYTGNLSTYND